MSRPGGRRAERLWKFGKPVYPPAMVSERLRGAVVRALEVNRPGRSVLRAYRRVCRRRDPRKPRVLCVGFRKTGTTSLGMALRQLGFAHCGFDRDLWDALRRGEVERCLRFASHFDSLDDVPWSEPTFIAAFRRRFPGSRYVMLLREEESWLRSFLGYFGPRWTPGDALTALRDHNARVEALLADEPHVLRMNLCGGEGYEILCPFLGMETPATPFPWANRAGRSRQGGV